MQLHPLYNGMKNTSHRDSLAKNTKPYEVTFSDVEGPMPVTGHDGSRFFLHS